MTRAGMSSADVSRRGRCAGMTLIEILGYLAIMAVLINICAVAFLQSSRIAQLGETALLRLDTLDAAGRDFCRAVHRAQRVEPSLEGFVTTDEQVVLRLPSSEGNPAETHFIVFGKRGDEPLAMTEYVRAGDGLQLLRHKRYPVRFEEVRITCEPSVDPRSVTLDLRILKERLDNRTGNGAHVVASLRCPGGGAA